MIANARPDVLHICTPHYLHVPMAAYALEKGIHVFMEKPEWVDASAPNHHLKGVIEVEDTIEAYIRFGDKVACFYATNGYCADVPPLIEVCCSDVTIRIEDLDVSYRYPNGTIVKPQVERPVPIGTSYWGSGHAACIGDFYCAIENNTSFALELSSLEESIRLMLGIYESAREKHVVRFD